jgi:hypothetical protein
LLIAVRMLVQFPVLGFTDCLSPLMQALQGEKEVGNGLIRGERLRRQLLRVFSQFEGFRGVLAGSDASTKTPSHGKPDSPARWQRSNLKSRDG